MNDVLAKVEKAEPEIGALLRRCCAEERNRRPTTKQLVHSFKRLNGNPAMDPRSFLAVFTQCTDRLVAREEMLLSASLAC